MRSADVRAVRRATSADGVRPERPDGGAGAAAIDSSAATISRVDEKRSTGSFLRLRSTIAQTSAGISRGTSGAGGSAARICAIVDDSECPSNGCRPV